jgi:outer membrane receptor for ferrienterochelin and colicins
LPDLFGQQGIVQGTLRSASGPVAYGTVLIRETGAGTAADEHGHFALGPVKSGAYRLEFSAVGYKTTQRKVEVNESTIDLVVELEEDRQSLDAVVITGTMKEVRKLQSPIPVESYAPELFRKNPTPSIFEGLALINGVQPQLNCNVCGAGDIRINGLDGPYTMVLLDGMPIVSSLSTVYGLSGIPNSLVKRIEVVKGPASTLYGSEAVGGVINIITQDAREAASVMTDVFGTSIGELNLDVGVVFRTGKTSVLTGLNYYTFTNPRDINNDNFIDAALQNRFSLFNKWNFSTHSSRPSSLAGRLFYEDRWGGERQWTKQERGSDQVYGESIYTKRFELIGTHPLFNSQRLTADYSLNHHHQDSYYGITSYQARQVTAFTQVRWQETIGNHDVLIGLPYRYVFYDDNTPGTSNEQAQNSPAITHLPGVFIQDEIRLHSRLSTLLGLRYDHHNVHGSIVTPRFSIKYSPGKNNVIRFTGGNGFRVVNLFTEDHAALTGARQVVIRNDLLPEQSWNLNLNYMHTIPFHGGFLSLDGSIFYTHFTNRILGDFLSDPDKIIYDNLNGFAVSEGVSLSVDASFVSGLKFISGATLMNVYTQDDATGKQIPQVLAPRFSGTAAVSYSSRNDHWLFDLTSRIQGPMPMPVVPDDFRPANSPWVPLLNLQITRHFHAATGHWEIYGGIKNLLNFIPINPILRPFDPFDRNIDVDNPYNYTFDTAYNYAPVQGLRGFLGVRYTLK